MKKTLLFKSIALSLFMLFGVGVVNAQVFISQNCDPQANYVADRFAEIYNPSGNAVDLTGWTLENIQAGAVSFTWTLTGSIASGEALICGNADATNQTITPDITATWAGNSWNGKGIDGTILKNAAGDVVDYAVQADATGTFENAEMVRNSNITTPTATYDAAEWTFTAVTNAVDATPGTHTADAAALVATDLFISEYVEGKIIGNNRAVEIFNGTGAEVDLSAYTLKQSYTGEGWGIRGGVAMTEYVLPLSGALADGDAYVVYNNGADAAVIAVGDLATTYDTGTPGSRFASFTGNDPVGLFKNDVLIDIIGVELETTGPWAVAGVNGATQDNTLIRKNTITQGNTDWTTSAGTDADDSEWVVYSNATADKVDNLGSHTFGTSTVDATAPTFTAVPEGGDTEVAINTTIVLTFDEAIRNIDDSEITDANVAALLTFKETDASGADVPFTATIDAAKKVITVTPDADLKINQVYYGAIAPVEDALDNATTESSMTFTTITKYAVTFNVDMSLVEGFVPASDIVYIAGNLAGWAGPGSNAAYALTDTDGNMIYTIVLGVDLTADPVVSDIAYKFFLNAGWDGGEWAGDPNRTATITENTTLNHIFGNRGEAIFVNVPFVQRFNYITNNTTLSLAGWTNTNVATGGTAIWGAKVYNSDGYGQATSYGSTSTGADQIWLITPGIKMDNSTTEELSFDVNIGYWTHNGLSVKISTDYDQTVAGITTATWTDVTADFTIPSTPTNAYGTFASAGHLDVSTYSGNMYVAFVYDGNKTATETTTYQIDNVVVAAVGTVGFDELPLSELSIYPNPSNGKFFVEMGSALKANTKIEVFNVIGMKVFEILTNDFKTEIDLSSMKQGVYFVRVDDGANILTQKIMKQ